MRDPREELTSAWSVLTRPKQQAFNAYALQPTVSGEVRVAIDRQGLRHLLVEGEHPGLMETASGVLAVDYGPIVFADTQRSYLDICCTDPTLDTEFQEVVLDVLDAIAGDPAPTRSALEVIGRWRRLLRATALSGLRENERVGVFAELSVLQSLLTEADSISLSAWTGPLAQAHDFELDDRCLEVKAAGHDSSTVRIHGLDQLDRHDDKPLHVILAIVESDENGATIPDLVARIRGLLTTDHDLDRRLASARIDPADPLLSLSRYTITSSSVVDVSDATPRLVPSTFIGGLAPVGVGNVAYDIQIAELLGLGRAIQLRDPSGWWLR